MNAAVPQAGPEIWPTPLRLIAALAGPEPVTWTEQRLTDADWSAFADLVCGRHKLAPVVAPRLSGLDVPPAIAAGIAAEARENAKIALQQMVVLRGLSTAFIAAGLRVAILKGLPLAARLYGGAGNRHARDIDLAVPEVALAECVRILREHGFRVHAEHTLRGRIFGTRSLIEECNDLAFTNEDNGTIVELHWRSGHFRGWPDWIEQGEWCSAEGSPDLFVLPPSADMIYLATHGAMHMWGRLKWLADVARMAVWRGEAGIADDLRQARARSASAGLEQGLALAVRLGWLPEGFAGRLEHPAAVGNVIEKRLAAIADANSAPGTPAYRLGFYREGWRLSGSAAQRLGVLRYGTWRRARLLAADLMSRGTKWACAG